MTRDRDRDDALRTEKGRGRPWDKRVGFGNDLEAIGHRTRGKKSAVPPQRSAVDPPRSGDYPPPGSRITTVTFHPSPSAALDREARKREIRV